jgi:hypothetical protein
VVRACNFLGEMVTGYKIAVVKLKGRDNLGRLGLDGRIILKWNLQKLGE